ncbi:hypothetical protein F2Q69_00022868 [Brassica cretica]|uniref:Uncharacterized protein n=1 Tax=Brassica cretica TaxID=69181 RepID=A0A8S9QJJ1_BRACR|nr:hypothetical protein F2Q69_00022868 [Brassica cretica]
MDQNSKKKLDGDQHTSRGDLETSKASIDQHQPDEIDRQPSHIIDQRPPYIIDRQSTDSNDLHPHSIIDLHPPDCIDRLTWLDELPGYIVELEQHVEASQRGLRFRDEVDKGPVEAASVDTDRIPSVGTDQIPSNNTNKPASIDATASPSIDTGGVSEPSKFDVCGNLRDGDTTTRSDKFGGKKRRNWKKRKRIKDGPQVSLIPHFSDASIDTIARKSIDTVANKSIDTVAENREVKGNRFKEEELMYQQRSTTTGHCRSTEHHEYRSIAT